MTQRSRFFDSSAGDRIYTSDAWAQVVTAINTDGVVSGSGAGAQMGVIQSTPAAMTVKVGLGQVLIQGYYLEVYSAAESLSITAANSSNPRIDRIVARRDLSGRTCLLAVLTGTPAATPAAPALTQNAAGIWEICLATVYVAAGATSIVTASITDTRAFAQGPDVVATLSPSGGHRHDGADSRTVRYTDLGNVPAEFAPTDHGHTSSGDGGTLAWSTITGKPSYYAPTDHGHTASGDGGTVAWSSVTGRPSTYAPSAHATTHETGGSDAFTAASIGGHNRQSAGGGSAGPNVWVGTSDPGGSASEGDIWIAG